jgi:hypothetical protein
MMHRLKPAGSPAGFFHVSDPALIFRRIAWGCRIGRGQLAVPIWARPRNSGEAWLLPMSEVPSLHQAERDLAFESQLKVRCSAGSQRQPLAQVRRLSIGPRREFRYSAARCDLQERKRSRARYRPRQAVRYHNRSPVILEQTAVAIWLGSAGGVAAASSVVSRLDSLSARTAGPKYFFGLPK